MKKTKAASILFNITTVFCFIYFALYIFTLVFIPIGIECFVAGRRFSYKAENPHNTIVLPNKILRNWVIFASIFVFPFGLLSIIAYFLVCSNSISVSSVETEENRETNGYVIGENNQVFEKNLYEENHKQESADNENDGTFESKTFEGGRTFEGDGTEQVDERDKENISENVSEEQIGVEKEPQEKASKEAQQVKEETEEEKLEKFHKLEKFKEKGLITAEELEMAREQLFGKKK